MENTGGEHMTDRERTLIAMGAAMGADKHEINLCLAIARMVRKKAAGFSDQEVGETQGDHQSDTLESSDKAVNTSCNAGCSCGCK